MNGRFAVTVFALSAGLAQAQVQGVVSGYVIDPYTRSIRAVLGIPGAARLGAGIASGKRIAQGVVRNGRALVITYETPARVYVVRNLGATAPETIEIHASISPVTGLYLNAGGTMALLYSSKSRSFQFVQGLDSTPVPADAFPESALSGTFAAATLADSSACALVASVDQVNSYVQQVCAGSAGSVATLAQLPGVQISSISWFRNDQDAVIADSGGNQILLLPNAAQGSAPVVLAGSGQGIVAPVAVLPLGDTSIAVIDRGSASLLIIDAQSGWAPRVVALPAVPTRLEFLDAPGVLACTGIGRSPLLLVDQRQNFQPFFVPMDSREAIPVR